MELNTDGKLHQSMDKRQSLHVQRNNNRRLRNSLLPFDFQLKNDALEQFKRERLLKKAVDDKYRNKNNSNNFYDEANSYDPFDPTNVDISLSRVNENFQRTNRVTFDQCSRDY